VTGASRGIGAGIARSLAAEGARVVLVARNQDALAKLAAEIGNDAVVAATDVTDQESVRSMSVAVTSTLGGAPDVVVNNAGVFEVAPLETMPAKLFTDVIDTNLLGPFLVARAFIAEMRARGSGHFVTIGSIADRHALPENGAYAPAKHALRAMHEVLREELRGSGVRATLVSPGPVDTAMWDGIAFGEERVVPARERMLRPRDVAAAVMYAVLQPASVNVDELRISHS
jgi:NADP-dependent 3-hydroxy acid dehydrogenase YdfG